LNDTLTAYGKITNNPDASKLLMEAIRSYNEAEAKRKINNDGQIDILNKQIDLEDIKARNNQFLNSLIIKQIELSGQTEVLEVKRKTQSKLDADLLDRQMSDEGRFLGMGVIGKANERSRIRLLSSRQRIADQEVEKSISAQSSYASVLDAQRNILLEQASELDKSSPFGGFLERAQAESLVPRQIQNAKDLSLAIKEVEQIKFIGEKETERVKTLTNLKKIQQEIISGKIEEEEITKRINAEELRNAQRSTSIIYGFKQGFDDLRDEADTGLNKLARSTPMLFRDGMVDAIKATVRETDNLNDALMGVAARFLDTFSTQLMSTGISKIISGSGLGNLFGMQTGGLIRAQSGMYISGTGSGDKYPALLENGEYVLNRRAVMAMGGPAALDTLNFSMAPRFASGGSFNAELSDIKAMEEGMTTFGLENSSLYKELRDAEIQKAEEARQKRRARQAQRAQMIGSLVAAVATIGIGAGISNKMQNIQAGKAQNLSAKLQTGQPLTNAESLSIRGFMNKGLINSSGVYTGPEIVRTGFSGFTGVGGRQTGGLIGSRLSDTIPGYMEGGLYNSPMVRKYGTGMQSGGMSSIANNSNVVNNSNASNSFNFNTTVNRDGTIQMGANNTSYKQQDVELSNNLNDRIYGAVLNVIRDQQRFGGSLAGTRKV
jgi:hypothetical protein